MDSTPFPRKEIPMPGRPVKKSARKMPTRKSHPPGTRDFQVVGGASRYVERVRAKTPEAAGSLYVRDAEFDPGDTVDVVVWRMKGERIEKGSVLALRIRVPDAPEYGVEAL